MSRLYRVGSNVYNYVSEENNQITEVFPYAYWIYDLSKYAGNLETFLNTTTYTGTHEDEYVGPEETRPQNVFRAAVEEWKSYGIQMPPTREVHVAHVLFDEEQKELEAYIKAHIRNSVIDSLLGE